MMKAIRNAIGILGIAILVLAIGACQKKAQVSKAELRKVSIDDIELAYKRFGRGDPVLLIMGFSGTMDMWPERFLEGLAEHHQVIIYDSRGIGESGVSDKKFSIELFADDAASLLGALGIKKAHVLGWSMGTNVAQELVLRHPEKVSKLILYAADCGGKEMVQPEEPLKIVTDTSGTLQEREARVIKVLFPEEWLRDHPDIREFFPFPKERSLVENVNRQAQAMFEWQGSYSRLGQIRQPVLLITGTEDVIPPPINSFIIAEKIPGAWVTQIKGGGHGVIFQYPEEFLRIVLLFLGAR